MADYPEGIHFIEFNVRIGKGGAAADYQGASWHQTFKDEAEHLAYTQQLGKMFGDIAPALAEGLVSISNEMLASRKPGNPNKP